MVNGIELAEHEDPLATLLVPIDEERLSRALGGDALLEFERRPDVRSQRRSGHDGSTPR
jgi:hypothetical protein